MSLLANKMKQVAREEAMHSGNNIKVVERCRVFSPNCLVSKVLSYAGKTALFTAMEVRVIVPNLVLFTGDNA